MEADKLTKRIVFTRLEQADTDGRTDFGWTPFCTVWAGVNVSSYRRFEIADAVGYENTVLFSIRYRPAIAVFGDVGRPADLRIYYNERPFAIIGMKDPDEAHEMLHITATSDLEACPNEC